MQMITVQGKKRSQSESHPGVEGSTAGRLQRGNSICKNPGGLEEAWLKLGDQEWEEGRDGQLSRGILLGRGQKETLKEL